MSTHRTVTRLSGLLVAGTFVLAACSSSGASTAPSAAAPSAAATSAASGAAPSAGGSAAAAGDPKTATSAAAAGGVDAVCAAGKAEGQVNLIATPPDWANYGQMITDFTAKYGIKVQSDQPDVDSAAEITAAKNLAGTGRQPDIFDLTTTVALANTAMLAPYQVAAWADIPDTNKEATGLWTNNYTGYQSISYDSKLGDITKVADLPDPKYKGKVALNGDPLKSGSGFNGVVLAALANGGTADNIAPGVDFFKKLSDSGNLIPVDPNPSTIASGQTPIVIDWTYNEGPRPRSSAPRASTGRSSSRVTPRPSPRTTTTPSTRTRRIRRRSLLAGVRLLAGGPEHLAEGLRGPGPPADDGQERTADQAALAAIGAPSQAPVQLTQDQIKAATDYLTANWKFITIK